MPIPSSKRNLGSADACEGFESAYPRPKIHTVLMRNPALCLVCRPLAHFGTHRHRMRLFALVKIPFGFSGLVAVPGPLGSARELLCEGQ